jgi:imidazolonepropionase-like amidohydrolase
MLLIRASQLIDGSGGSPLRDAAVLVQGEKILQVGKAQEVQVPPGAEIIDAGDKTVMPSMVDAHVHVQSVGGPAVRTFAVDQISKTQGFLALRSYSNVRKDLEMGFTALRTLHTPGYVDVALRDAIDQGLIEGPRIKAAGQGLTITGGHMDHGDWAPEVTVAGRTGVCDGPWACRRAAREQLKRGADLVKINAAGGSYEDLTRPGEQEMTYEEMAAICEEARWARKRVAAHAHGGSGITDAIRAGVNSIEHGLWLSKEQVELMAEKGVFYVPTLCTHTRGLELGPEELGAQWDWLVKMAKEVMWRSLDLAREAGVKIAVGTDAGFWIYHGENALELEELVKGGFTPMEAIVAATRIGAECLDLHQMTGTIEAGKCADLLIVRGDPLTDVRILQHKENIMQVFKGGKRVMQTQA